MSYVIPYHVLHVLHMYYMIHVAYHVMLYCITALNIATCDENVQPPPIML